MSSDCKWQKTVKETLPVQIHVSVSETLRRVAANMDGFGVQMLLGLSFSSSISLPVPVFVLFWGSLTRPQKL